MSTMLHVRGARTRNARFRPASVSMMLACLILVTGPSASLAQKVPTSGTSVSKSRVSQPSAEKTAARFEAYRANFDREITREDLELFVDHTPVQRNQLSVAPTNRFAKGSSSVFDDMQLLPDQTFENSNGWGTPSVVAISEELIGMVYADQGINGPEFFGEPEVGPRALFRTSNDGGASWSDPVVVADDADFILDYNWLSISINAGGRLLIIDETPFEENHSFYSDDFGATWTEIAYEETDFRDQVLGPVNGQFWRQAGASYPDQTNVQYETSDDGINWNDAQIMLASVGMWNAVDLTGIAWTGGSNYVATFNLFNDEPDCCIQGIGVSRSTDNGATWSTVERLDYGEYDETNPTVASDGAGNVFVAFTMPNPDWIQQIYDQTVYTLFSDDGGATFSDPVAFTRFVGDDYVPNMAMAGPDPFLTFHSTRGTFAYRTRIWYGLAGANQTPDVDPNPAADWYSSTTGWVPAERGFPIRAIAFDETGIESVLLRAFRGGDELPSVELFDDGEHDDEEAGDGIFGGTTDAYEYGLPIAGYLEAIDTGGNSGFSFQVNVTVAALHDVGELVTVVTPDGGMGFEPLQDWPPGASGAFPKSSEDVRAFLAYAGLWVGINKAPGKRVSHMFYDNLFGPDGPSTTYGDWQVIDYPSEAPGESELDIVMHYDDSGGPHPIGLDVMQTTYQWSDANYVIFDYVITNQSGGDLSNLYVAMVMDPDVPVGADPFDDQVGYDIDRSLLYEFDGGGYCADHPEWCTDLHVGISLLSDGTDLAGKNVPAPFTAHRWSGFSEGDPFRNSTTGLDVDAYDIMTRGIWPGFNLGLTTTVDEWRIVLTAQPFNLAAGESRRVVFGMVAGAGVNGIKASTDAMISRFNNAVLAVEQTSTVPTEFALGQNYPNPFNPSTTIPFSVASTSPVSITVFDILGRQVERIVDQTLSAGSYTATFESEALPSGAYYYTLTADGQSITKSMFLLK